MLCTNTRRGLPLNTLAFKPRSWEEHFLFFFLFVNKKALMSKTESFFVHYDINMFPVVLDLF